MARRGQRPTRRSARSPPSSPPRATTRHGLPTCSWRCSRTPRRSSWGGSTSTRRRWAGSCVAVLSRWHHELGPGGEPWFDDPHVAFDGATGDLLFTRLLEVPGAATQFAARVQRSTLGCSIGSTYDLERFQTLVLTATDPAHASTEQAGRIIVPLLGFLRDREPPLGGGPVENLNDRGWLGELVTPWIWQLSYRSSEWGLDLRAANRWLRFVLDDPAAMASLLARRDDWLRGLAGREVDLSSWARRWTRCAVCSSSAGSSRPRPTTSVSATRSAQAAWGTTWMLADTALSIATSGLSPVAGYTMGVGASSVEQVAAGATALPDPQATEAGGPAPARRSARRRRERPPGLASDRALRAAGDLRPGICRSRHPRPRWAPVAAPASCAWRSTTGWRAPDLPPTAGAGTGGGRRRARPLGRRLLVRPGLLERRPLAAKDVDRDRQSIKNERAQAAARNGSRYAHS